MTFPEDLTQPVQPTRPPNYWLGLLLNVFIPGSGFTVINQWPWHLGWLAILIVLNLIGAVLGMLTTPLLLLLPVLAWVGMLVHYHLTYQRAAARQFAPPVSDGVKVALIATHFGLGFLMTGILAAVLIPNLLGARQRAQQVGEDAVARQILLQVVADQVDRKPLTTTCPAPESLSTGNEITACRVDISDPDHLAVDVTFESGRTVHMR